MSQVSQHSGGGIITPSPDLDEAFPQESEQALDRALRTVLEQKAHAQQELLRLEQCLSDYQSLAKELETLPERVERPLLVPHGKMAMFPGKLVHTNEVMVLLGDNYFALRSAKQASELALRRAAWVQPQLGSKQAEIDALAEQAQQLQSMHDITSEQQGAFEIREEYNSDDDDGRLWLGAGGSGLRSAKDIGLGRQGTRELGNGASVAPDKPGAGGSSNGGGSGGGECFHAEHKGAATEAAPAPDAAAAPAKISRFKTARLKATEERDANLATSEQGAGSTVAATPPKRVSFDATQSASKLASLGSAQVPGAAVGGKAAAKIPVPSGIEWKAARHSPEGAVTGMARERAPPNAQAPTTVATKSVLKPAEPPTPTSQPTSAPPTYPTKPAARALLTSEQKEQSAAHAAAPSSSAAPQPTAAVTGMVVERSSCHVPTEVEIVQREVQKQLVERESFRGRHGTPVDDLALRDEPPSGVSRFKAARMKASGRTP